MAWILLYITIKTTGVEVIPVELYQDMTDCFAARAEILYQSGSSTEFFPINQQAICVQTNIL